MVSSTLDQPSFHAERAAFAYLEAQLWPNGPTCPQLECKTKSQRIGLLNKTRKNVRKGNAERVLRLGIYKCYHCGSHFTVRKGTIFEGSHLPLHLWLQVIHLMLGSDRPVTTRQVQAMLGCSLKTAWSAMNRVRQVLKQENINFPNRQTNMRQLGAFDSDDLVQSRRFIELSTTVGTRGTPDDLQLAIKTFTSLRREVVDAPKPVRCVPCGTKFNCNSHGLCSCMELPHVVPLIGDRCLCPKSLDDEIASK